MKDDSKCYPSLNLKVNNKMLISSRDDSIKKKTYAEKLCAFYVERPKLTFVITLGIQVSLMLATSVLYLMDYEIFPYDFTQVPLNLEKDATKLRADAFNFVTEDSRINLLPSTAIPQAERTLRSSPLELVYELKSSDDNVITRHNLRVVALLEDELYKNPSYQKICHRNSYTNNCSQPMSVIRLFDGTFKTTHSSFFDPFYQNVTHIFNLANSISQTKSLISFSMDKNAIITPGHVKSKYLRSVLFNGLPLIGYKHAEDRKKEQHEKLKLNIVEAFSGLLAKKYESGIGNMRVYYMNLDLFFNAVEKQVVWDLLLAGGSLIFIFCFIWFQTGSLWITWWAVFGIITNFFGANLVYRIILDFRFIGIFHVLSVFMILGIGADDVFVFYNTWKLMESKHFDNLTEHLTETFRVAAGAMFVTSLTTAAAFLASAASPLLGVSSFGVFSGILVIVNYLSVCMYFPSVVVTYHYYWKDKQLPCIFKGNQNTASETTRSSDAPQDDMTKLFKAVVNWFETTYANRIVLHHKIKWILLTLFMGLSIMFLVFAVQLGPDEEQVQVWPKGTNWYDMRQIKLKAFEETGEGSNVIRIYTVFGLKLQDRTNCHFTDYKCKGKTVFDEDFDMNAPGCQKAVLKFCRRLKQLGKKEAESLGIRRSVATGELEVSCFIDEMDRYLRHEVTYNYHKYSKNPVNYNFSIPLNGEKVKQLMSTLPIIYNVSLIGNEYYHYFETALGYWLSAGGNRDKRFDYHKYAMYMGGSLDKTSPEPPTNLSQAQGGRYGNRLRYVAIVVNTSLTGATLKYNLGKRVYNNWEKYIKEQTKDMPPSCKHAFQCTPEWNNWHWLKVQGELLKGARTGIMIGLCLAFPVLVFTTCNWIIGILATVTIGLITLAVVGLIPLVGWNLGVMESINLTLVVGLAVDYAVHLADGYVRCLHFKREDRVRYMLGNVGVSVLAGAATTLGASAFMLGSKILFFFQFGVFMFCTIGFSIVYALVVFAVIVAIIGPEGDRGSLRSLYDCIRRMTSSRENHDALLATPSNSMEKQLEPNIELHNINTA